MASTDRPQEQSLAPNIRPLMPDQLRQLLRRRLTDVELDPARARRRSQLSPSLAYGRHSGPPAPDARAAAVLILLEPCQGSWSIPLTVRPDHLPDHPGQISFPGGRLETDETPREAAEREFEEELGVRLPASDLIGELQPMFVFGSNYQVHAWVAVSDRAWDYTPCSREVARVLRLPITALQRTPTTESFSRGRVSWTAPTIKHQSDRIWGATAILLGELSANLVDVLPTQRVSSACESEPSDQ